jgi:nucleoside-diphosphate-sugar epimerase
MAKRRVVLTGAAGYVAQRMFRELSERWDLVPIDVRDTTRDGAKVPGMVIADLTRPDRDEYRRHFQGADAVIHCGYVSARGLDATTWQNNSDAKFQSEHANVALAYNVYRTALEEGVRRVVVASSNHAADYYERLVWAGRLDMVTPEMPPRSDNWYGWAKAAYELLGFVFATGQVDGKKLATTTSTTSRPGTSSSCTARSAPTSPGAIRSSRPSGWSRRRTSRTSTGCPS